MSEHSKILEKYEKMFEDGSAYNPIHLTQPQPDVAGATEVEEKSNVPLGQPVEKDVFMDDQHHTDYSEFDSSMQNRIDELRSKANNPMQNNTPNVRVQNNSDYEKIEKRVTLLEKALELVMETQTKMLK